MWEQTSILRTRIFEQPGHGLMQVVVGEATEWLYCEGRDSFETEIERRPMGLGTRLSWVAVVHDAQKQSILWVWTVHHSLYDGWSIDLLFRRLENLYYGAVTRRIPLPLGGFIRYCVSSSCEDSLRFWKNALNGATCSPWPAVPPTYRAKANNVELYNCARIQWQNVPFSSDTVLRTALAVVLARYTGQDETLFGVVTTGRKAPVLGVERMCGPTIATMPVRTPVNGSMTLRQLLKFVQDREVAMINHEQTGIDGDERCVDITGLSEDGRSM